MKRAILAVAVFLIASSSTSARSDDEGSEPFLGFSEDGRYLAWEDSGVQDGSDDPYSHIYILDVERNRYAAPPVSTILSDLDQAGKRGRSQTGARQINLRKAKALLNKFGIEKRFQGERQKILHYRRVPARNPNHEHMVQTTEQFKWRNTDWTLVLKEVADKMGRDEGWGLLRMFDLRLRGEGKEQVLQKDTQLPSSRGSVYEYDLGSVWTYKSSLVVLVSYVAPGFEVQDTRLLFVTAKVP